MLTAQLDTGITIATWIACVFILIGGGVAIGFAILKEVWGVLATIVCTALIAGITLFFAWFPFGYDYNHYVPKSGTVTAVASRILSDGNGGISQREVVYINGQPYGCDDSRCAPPGMHKGVKVTLMCEKEFQFNAPSQGFACNWGKLGLNQ
jgi:hypothetical protein